MFRWGRQTWWRTLMQTKRYKWSQSVQAADCLWVPHYHRELWGCASCSTTFQLLTQERTSLRCRKQCSQLRRTPVSLSGPRGTSDTFSNAFEYSNCYFRDLPRQLSLKISGASSCMSSHWASISCRNKIYIKILLQTASNLKNAEQLCFILIPTASLQKSIIQTPKIKVILKQLNVNMIIESEMFSKSFGIKGNLSSLKFLCALKTYYLIPNLFMTDSF